MSSSTAVPTAFRDLVVQREDAISPPPIRPVRWRGRAAAAIVLVGILAGVGAWFRVDDVSAWLTSHTAPVSLLAALSVSGA